MKRMQAKIMVLLVAVLIAFCFASCQQESEPDIDIYGRIYYTTGDYPNVDHITFEVSGGTAPYKIYYARSIDSWDYAWSGRSYKGTCNENEEFTVSASGYISAGWYYYIWAVDSDGYKGRARWHP